MNHSPSRWRPRVIGTLPLALGLVLTFAAALQACNVPVFRFALERWRPDPYRITVFHRGPLDEAARAAIADLQTREETSSINLTVRTLDLAEPEGAEPEDADRALFASFQNPAVPLLVVQYPEHLRIQKPVWSGPLTAESTSLLTGSPTRKAVVQGLLEGKTAVWLLLECGDPARNEAAAQTLQNQLKTLEKELELPELTESPDDTLLTTVPVKVAFSVLRVPRDAAEQPLVQMLLHSEPDLAERSDPMVFPVFGRGRALLPLVGAGITDENIRNSAAFLVGACSCEVKELNPGFDLLLSADWDGLLKTDGDPLPSGLLPDTGDMGEPELVPIPRGSSKPKSAAAVSDASHSNATHAEKPVTPKSGETMSVSGSPSRFWIVAGLALGAAAAIIGLLRRGRSTES